MASFVMVAIVVGFTLLAVIISERMHRDELVKKAVKSETQTMDSELIKTREALDSIKRLSVLQENEILELRKQLALKMHGP